MTDTERETLCTRIDELCAELNRTQLNRDMWLIRAKVTLKNLTSARAENAKLQELCADIYKRFRGVVFECWAYSSEDFRMYEQRMRELGIEVDE